MRWSKKKLAELEEELRELERTDPDVARAKEKMDKFYEDLAEKRKKREEEP